MEYIDLYGVPGNQEANKWLAREDGHWILAF